MKPARYLLGYCLAAAFIALLTAAFVTGTPILQLMGLASILTPSAEAWSGWMFWGILLLFAALPALIGAGLDGKGQGASGFVLLIGIGISVILGMIWLAGFLISSFVGLFI